MLPSSPHINHHTNRNPTLYSLSSCVPPMAALCNTKMAVASVAHVAKPAKATVAPSAFFKGAHIKARSMRASRQEISTVCKASVSFYTFPSTNMWEDSGTCNAHCRS
jgi:predicted PhzF superfamily epimerase YddE/YHI9